jgi:hypothetical protein
MVRNGPARGESRGVVTSLALHLESLPVAPPQSRFVL